MRSMWSGAINFGLVSIPVKLYTAVKESHLHFNFLRKDDLCPIGYKKVCRKTGEEVPKEDIVRGYEYQKGDFIILDEKDFEKADVDKMYPIPLAIFQKVKIPHNQIELDLELIDKLSGKFYPGINMEKAIKLLEKKFSI